MAKTKTKTSAEFTIVDGRLSFPVLETPKAFREGLTPRFEATFLLDPTTAAHAALIKEMKAAIGKLALDVYGEIPREIASGETVALHNNVVTTRDPDTGAVISVTQAKKYSGYKDMYYLVTSTPAEVVDKKAKPQVPVIVYMPDGRTIDYYKGRPPIINRAKRPVREGQPEFPYGGCYVNAIVSFWAQDLALGFGPRINANLLAIQFSKDGESFGRGQIDVNERFTALEDATPTSRTAVPAGFLGD